MSASPRLYILAGILVVITVATLWLLPAASSTQNAITPLVCPTLPESDALARDAQHYARDFGVTVEEAICRLTVQDEIGHLASSIRSGEPDTFAGLWIHHEPEYGVTVLFTENPQATLSPYVKDSALAGIIKARKAKVSLRYLKQAQRQAHTVASAIGIPAASGISVPRNRVELYVMDIRGFTRALRDSGLRLPDHVKLVRVEQHSSPAS